MVNEGYLIAVIGSVRQEISGSAEIEAQGRETARELGRALGDRGFRLIVYSSSDQFIEPHVVAGFADAAEGRSRAVTVKFPSDKEISFAEQATYPGLFQLHPDHRDYWEASFYRSLAQVDGMLLIGGGRSTLAAGHIALNAKVPIAAIKGFGGEADRIWRLLPQEAEYADSDDVNAMASRAEGANQIVVDGLFDRCERIAASKARKAERIAALEAQAAALKAQSQMIWPAALAGVAFLAVIGLGVSVTLSDAQFSLLFIAALCVAGVLGSSVSMLWNFAQSRRPSAVLFFGGVAGLIVGLSYALPLIAGRDPKLPFLWDGTSSGAILQLILASVTAFLAGFAYDAFMARARVAAEEKMAKALSG